MSHEQLKSIINAHYTACLYTYRLLNKRKASNLFIKTIGKRRGLTIIKKTPSSKEHIAEWHVVFEGLISFSLCFPYNFPISPPVLRYSDDDLAEILDFELSILSKEVWTEETQVWEIIAALRELVFKGAVSCIQTAPGSPTLTVTIKRGSDYLSLVS